VFDEDKEKAIAWEKSVERNIAIAEAKAKGCGTPNYCAKRGCVNKIIDQECQPPIWFGFDPAYLYGFSAFEMSIAPGPQLGRAKYDEVAVTFEEYYQTTAKQTAEIIYKAFEEAFVAYYSSKPRRLHKIRMAARSRLRNIASKFRRKGYRSSWRRGSTRHGKK
jgi:hypothetical protein